MVNTGSGKYSSQFLENAKSKTKDKSQRRTMRTTSKSLLYKHNEERYEENAPQVRSVLEDKGGILQVYPCEGGHPRSRNPGRKEETPG